MRPADSPAAAIAIPAVTLPLLLTHRTPIGPDTAAKVISGLMERMTWPQREIECLPLFPTEEETGTELFLAGPFVAAFEV